MDRRNLACRKGLKEKRVGKTEGPGKGRETMGVRERERVGIRERRRSRVWNMGLKEGRIGRRD